MAKVNLFTAAKIAMEEEDIGTSSSVSNDVAQNEVENIEAQNDVEEVAKLSSEIEQVASQIEEGIDEGEKLDEAIVEGEEVLENNEGGDVPEEAVEVAQEALNESILLLAGREAKKQFKPSLESYETNIQKLRVSLEAAKDFANNIWQKIKELYAKFVTMLKKFGFKIGAMFDKGAKQADALAKIFKQRTQFDGTKVTEEFKDRLAKAYPTFIKVDGLKDFKSSVVSGGFVKTEEKTQQIEEQSNSSILDASGQPIKQATTTPVTTSSKVKKSNDELLNASGVEPELKDDGDDGREAVHMVIPRRNFIWYIGNQGTTGSEKIEVEGSDIDTNDINFNATDLVAIAESIKSKAKGYKAEVNRIEKAINKKSKEIDKVRDADLKGAIDYEEKAKARKRANIDYKVMTQCSFQTLSSTQDFMAGCLAMLGILSSAYKRP